MTKSRTSSTSASASASASSSAPMKERDTKKEDDPQPVLSSSSSSSSAAAAALEGCSEIFVGGGWAGIYSLYRRVTSYPNFADRMCLMEASWRIGGRTYSVPINHTSIPFIQDIGAYRFSPDMHLVGDLILHELNLPTECYQMGCPSAKEDFPQPFMFNYSAPLRRIVNPITGLPSGYATALHTMVDRVKTLGARVFTQMKLVKFDLVDTTTTTNTEVGSSSNGNNKAKTIHLVFEDTVTGQLIPLPYSSSSSGKGDDDVDDNEDGTITALFLNLPRNKLLDVQGVVESLDAQTVKTIQCIVFDAPADLFGEETAAEFHDKMAHYTTNLGKAYLYYPNAWWRTVLHQNVGKWPPNVGFAAVITQPNGVRFNIRWHDGPVVCDDDDNDAVSSTIGEAESSSTTCQGLLETYYSVSNETFYSTLPGSTPEEPLSSVWDTDGPEAQAVLLQAHTALLGLLDPLIQEQYKQVNDDNNSNTANSRFTLPTGLIVGTWHRPTEEYPYGQGYTAPTKVYYYPTESGTPDIACGVEGLTDDVYRDRVLQPWKTIDTGTNNSNNILNNVFLMNNDYSCLDVRYLWGDWAEETLLQAERAVTILGTPQPSWLDMDYYEVNIIDKLPSSMYATTKTMTLDTTTATTGDEKFDDIMLKLILLPVAMVSLIVVGWKVVAANKSRLTKQSQGEYTAIP